MEAGFEGPNANNDRQENTPNSTTTIVDSGFVKSTGFIKSPDRMPSGNLSASSQQYFTSPRVNVQAPSLLRNGNFTIQQQSTRLFLTSQTAKVKLLPRVNSDEEEKQTTQHGIIASFRTKPIAVDETEEDSITHYGSIDDDEEDFDKWMEKVDVSDFAPINQDIVRRQRKELYRKKMENAKIRDAVSAYPKPPWSYSSLIALALKNSESGELTVSEIYAFMLENFPYFRTAPSGWKNSVRHNLSLNKCFEKVEELEQSEKTRKSCLWRISPDRAEKLESDIRKLKEKNPYCIESLANKKDLEAIENGTKGIPEYSVQRNTTMLKTSPLQNRCIPESQAPPTHQRSSRFQEEFKRQNSQAELVRMMGAMCSPSKAYSQEANENIPCCSKSTVNSSSQSARVAQNLFHVASSSQTLQNSNSQQESSLLDGGPFDEFSYDHTISYHRISENDVNLNTTSIINQILKTPSKNSDKKDEASSPYRLAVPGYQFVRSALDENSLLSSAIEQSPYKSGPISFEDFLL